MSDIDAWPEVRAIDWSELPGAYGTDRDPVAALEALRTGPSAEDEFAEACDDFLWGHVWHQGTIYPLTPKVLPFVLEVLLHRPEEEEAEPYREMAEIILACAASARDDRESDIGAEVLAVLAKHGDQLRALTSLSDCMLAAMACVPALADQVLAGAAYPPRDVAAAIVSRVDRIAFEPSLLIWAAPHVAAVKHAVTRAAAEILKTGNVNANEERLVAVGQAIGFGNAELVKRYLDDMRPRFRDRDPAAQIRTLGRDAHDRRRSRGRLVRRPGRRRQRHHPVAGSPLRREGHRRPHRHRRAQPAARRPRHR